MGKSADLKNNTAVYVGFNPQALSGTSDITGEIIDTLGYESAIIVLTCDDVAASSLDAQLLIQEDSASDMSGASATADSDLHGTEAATALSETSDTTALHIGYRGSKRYIRPNLTVTANDGTDVVACTVILSDKKQTT